MDGTEIAKGGHGKSALMKLIVTGSFDDVVTGSKALVLGSNMLDCESDDSISFLDATATLTGCFKARPANIGSGAAEGF